MTTAELDPDACRALPRPSHRGDKNQNSFYTVDPWLSIFRCWPRIGSWDSAKSRDTGMDSWASVRWRKQAIDRPSLIGSIWHPHIHVLIIRIVNTASNDPGMHYRRALQHAPLHCCTVAANRTKRAMHCGFVCTARTNSNVMLKWSFVLSVTTCLTCVRRVVVSWF